MKVKFTKAYDAAKPGQTGTLLPPDRQARECGYVEVQLDEPHPQLGYWGNTIAVDLCEVEAYLQPLDSGSGMGEAVRLKQRGAWNVGHDIEDEGRGIVAR